MPAAAFAQTASAPVLSIVYAFQGGGDGASPSGVIVDTAGNLYGTTAVGGAYNFGTVFKLDAAGHESVLHSFSGPPDASSPDSGLLKDTQGNLYGTSSHGGTYNYGTVFKLDAAGHESVLYSFNTSAGGRPQAGAIDSLGTFYGTTSGAAGACVFQGRYWNGVCGSVFKVGAAGNYSVLYAFMGTISGAIPNGGLLLDAPGHLWGTTAWGGLGRVGVVFSMNTSGGEGAFHSFSGPDGAQPAAGVISDGARNLFGTTVRGGASNLGTVFKVDAAGHEAVLHSFAGGGSDGATPLAPLVLDAAGNLYGTTQIGGSSNSGTIFKLDPSGHFTVLHSFAGGMDGSAPSAGLVVDGAGNIYGATPSGGLYGFGTVFKLASAADIGPVPPLGRRV
jgi:uncharacterized repeat protein (TIGR03803 family)